MANEERESCPGQMPERVAEMAEALAETAQAYAAEMGCCYPECADCEAAGYCPGHKAARVLAERGEDDARYVRKELTFGEPAGDGKDVVFSSPTGDWGPVKTIGVITTTDEERVTDAAIRFVDAHKFYAETLPHRRKLCTRISQEFGPSCYVLAMEDVRANGIELLDEDMEDWCENCRHNRRMALARGDRAAKRSGALRRLVCAVENMRAGR